MRFEIEEERGILYLPRNVYTSKTLVKLSLAGNRFVVDVPSLPCLPSLQTLVLLDVVYKDENSHARLLANCPALSCLEVFRDMGDNVTRIMPRVHVETLSLQRQHVSSYVLRWASVIKGKGPSSGEMLTLDCDLWRSSPPHRRDVSCTFRIETVQPLLPLIDLKSGKCSSAVEARLLRFWEAKNVKRGGELMWVDLLLIDANVSCFRTVYYSD
ncbi:hypothetical protein F2Q70_00023664 [Brassica cretica]|uniref:F-box/LRR-repeat protein 15/At3g58940/PEG3-like LRR domain-containing protein n=1 Tax=Brassica cretica TaxID=69181 RepID=A0A8S9GRJ4_BRACR|nr:hypothetical protein F2Q70_00023664 [Brassica cretica]